MAKYHFKVSEWVKGLIAGIMATVIGVLLAIWWDYVNDKRQSDKQAEIFISITKDELQENVGLIATHKSLLQEEAKRLDQGEGLVSPLIPLRSSFWDLVVFDLPHKLVKEFELLNKIRKVARLTEQVNETIRSRENYRVNNRAMSNYNSELKQYDQLLLQQEEALYQAMRDLAFTLPPESTSPKEELN